MNLKFTTIVNERKDIPKLVEKTSNKGFVLYGDTNDFPDYLYQLYENSALFSSIVTTMQTYIFGEGIETTYQIPKYLNRKFETLEDIIKKAILDYIIFGGFALQIIRNKKNDIAEINYIDFRKIRVNEDEDYIYYGDFGMYARKNKIISYPKFQYNAKYNNSIYYYKGTLTRGVYPNPMYLGALKALELSTQISDYHLNQLINNFSPQCIINMNNGVVSTEEMEEIEERFNEKFLGTNNAGKIILSFNNDAEHQTTIERLADESYDTKYESLRQHTQDEIFTAFKLNPILVGLNNSNSGFTKQEFAEAYTLYQKTVISPIQQNLSRVLETLFNTEFKFKEFKIDWGDTNENGNIPTQEENKLINIEGIE